MKIIERNPETGELKEDFATIPGSQPTPEEKIAQLETEKAALTTQLAQTSTDLQNFMDFYFSLHPNG